MIWIGLIALLPMFIIAAGVTRMSMGPMSQASPLAPHQPHPLEGFVLFLIIFFIACSVLFFNSLVAFGEWLNNLHHWLF